MTDTESQRFGLPGAAGPYIRVKTGKAQNEEMFSGFPPKADLRPVAARAVLDAEIRQGADCISARPAAGPGRACGRAVPLRCRWCDFGYSCGGGATVGSGSWESARLDQVQAKAPAVRNACNFDYGVAPPGRRTVDTDPLHGSLATGVAADPSRSTNAREKHN